jgi:tetratricopeptide (TPR) repeat protein
MKSLTRLMRLGTAAAVCLIAAWPVRADEAAKDPPAAIQAAQPQPAKAVESAPAAPAAAQAPKPLEVAPAPAPARAEQPVPGDALEKDLEQETSKLQKMEAELKAVESLPLPSAAAPVVKVPVVKPAPDPKEVPKEPAKGLEEEYANALYAMGKYDLARAAYQRIIESKPKADILAWSRFQVGNCARHSNDLQAAGAAYEALMTASPTSPWTDEATWWAGEIKWWILWGQSTK